MIYKTPFSTRIEKYSSVNVVDEKRTRNTSRVRDGLLSPHGKHPAVSRSRCLGAVPLEVAGVATCITGPAGACIVSRGCSYWCPFAITGNIPLLFAARAVEFSACAEMVEVALVAFGKISHILCLLGWIAGRGSCIGSDGVLLFLGCLGGALFKNPPISYLRV